MTALITPLSSISSGWATGYNFVKEKKKEDELKQGKDYVLPAFSLVSQFFCAGSVLERLSDTIPHRALRINAQILCNVLPLTSIPFFLIAGAVRQGYYASFAKSLNSRRFLPLSLPTALGTRTTKVLCFVTEHIGDIFRVAMIVASIALISFGDCLFGISVLAGLTYEYVDRVGLLPRKARLFMEHYMPIVSPFCFLFSGMLVIRVASAISISTRIFPSISRFIHHRIDRLSHSIFLGPLLEEFDAPIGPSKSLAFDEIIRILNAPDSAFEASPAHMSKWASGLVDFPENRNLTEFRALFAKVNWEEKYSLIQGKLKEDDRFVDYLKENFPEEIQEPLTLEKLDSYFRRLAEKKNQTREQFAADWLKEQMEEVVAVLSGEKKVEAGTEQHVQDSIETSYKILTYLNSLDLNKDRVEYEDTLLSLAVEGGKYCARGIRRATGDILSTALQKYRPRRDNPAETYEQNIQGALQDLRHRIVQQSYALITQQLSVTDKISRGVHFFDIYRTSLSLGFYPLTNRERTSLDFASLLLWKTFTPIRCSMYEMYYQTLDQSIQEAGGEVWFAQYIRDQILIDPLLQEGEKDSLLEIYTEGNGNQWTPEETSHRFHRLMFIKLGVLRQKASA